MNTSVTTDCLAAVQPVLKIQQHAVNVDTCTKQEAEYFCCFILAS
jgi:hypothetical protein